MTRIIPFGLFAVLFAAGCEKKAPPGPIPVLSSAAVARQTQRSKAGGELVLVGAFYIDRTPVTQEMYEKVMGSNPAKKKDPKSPVAPVRWTDAARFLNKCSELDGLSPCYDLKSWECDLEADGYRLPTEAEWELACRAGGTGKYSFGDDPAELGKHAWFKGNSEGRTHPVGLKEPNKLGLYDMHGNVWQWCNDWYDASRKERVLRGGSWDSTPEKCAVDFRAKDFPAFTDACFGSDSYGFRRARTADGKKKVAAAATSEVVPATEAKAEVTVQIVQGKGSAAGLKGAIVFVSDRGGALDIWRMRADGSDQRPLTKDEHPDADPKVSPDGRKVLYTSARGGFPEVWAMSRDGGGAAKVAAGSQAAWSPDGKSIVLIRDNQAWVRDLAGGQERRVTPEAWNRCGVPAWSPDGQRIAVASRHQEQIGIYLVGPDGKDLGQLKTSEACCTPCWSSDGRRLLFQTTKGHIHQVELDGKNEEQLTFGADVQHDARFSPDGKRVVFCRAPDPKGPWQICIQPVDADDFVQLTKEGSNSLPDWHPLED